MKKIIEVATVYWLERLQQYIGIDWLQGNALAICQLIMAVLLGLAMLKILVVFIKVFKRVIHYRDRCRAAADRHASAGRPIVAARWYRRAGDRKQMANELAKAGFLAKQAGQIYKGIRLMEKAVVLFFQEGDYGAVGRIYEARKNFSLAVAAYLRAKDVPSAAVASARSGEFEAAIRMFCGYFKKTQDPPELQLQAAKVCWELLEPRGGYGAIPRKFRSRLLPVLAMRFDLAGEYWYAATAYYLLADYENCREALEIYLADKTVSDTDLELFYMLADVEDNLAHFEVSLNLFRGISAVAPNYRDVDERIKDISSRMMIFGSDAALPAPEEGERVSMMDTALRKDTVAQFAGQKRFTPIQQLGTGGWGEVWLVRDSLLDRDVVFKRPRLFDSKKADSKKAHQRFIKEAQMASKVEHSNVVKIHDIGEDKEGLYIVMEYVDGPNFGEYIRKRKEFSLEAVINIFEQICEGLGAVHQEEIIHRDLKPANILISKKGGKVKLTDFGLAVAEGNIVGQGGTWQYMAPEQVYEEKRKEKLDVRADIYALGLIIHEALTGQAVFAAAINKDKREAQEKPRPPSETAAEIPPELDAIVMKCLAENREERYRRADEVLHDLQRVALSIKTEPAVL